MPSVETTVVAAKQTVFSNLGDEVAILSLRSGQYYGLNAVGAFVWSLIQTPRTLAEICSAVEKEFDVTRERCEHDVGVLVDELRAQNLVDVGETP
jgi:hypothetical protein